MPYIDQAQLAALGRSASERLAQLPSLTTLLVMGVSTNPQQFHTGTAPKECRALD